MTENSESIKEGDGLLISLIQSYPHLWDKSHRDYKDHDMKAASWNEIAAGMKSTVDECQKRWKRIREYYSKERMKIEQETKSGSKQPNRKPWPLFPFLSFLEKCVHRRKTYTNYKSKSQPMNSESEESSDVIERQNQSEDIVDITEETSASTSSDTSNSDASTSGISLPPSAKKMKLSLKPPQNQDHQYNKPISKKIDETQRMMNIFSQASNSIQSITEKLTKKEDSVDQAICNMIMIQLQRQPTEGGKVKLRKKCLDFINESMASECE